MALTLEQQIEQLRAENERLRTKGRPKKAIKIAEKGGVSVYGLGRFPVTLYKEQWGELLGMADEIRAFIAAHGAELKTKAA